jgi:hypothetical protein
VRELAHVALAEAAQVPDFTTEPEGMLTLGPDVAVDPDPQPEIRTPTSTMPALQARRNVR